MRVSHSIYDAPVLVGPDGKLDQENLYGEAITTATILETSTAFKIQLEIPQSANENCKVRIDEGVVIVSGKGIIDLKLNLIHLARKKPDYGRFYRGFLPADWIGNENMNVNCKNRMLTINIPKKELTHKLVFETAIS